MHFLTAKQVRSLAGAAKRYETLVYLLAYTGLRWGEVAALRRSRVKIRRIEVVESVAEVGGILHFGETKTYQRRTVSLPSFLADMLSAHLEGRAEDPDTLVFVVPDGGPLRHSNFRRRVWIDALEAAKLPASVRIHDMRHTCAALLIAQGAHPKAIQTHLGHSSITVTMDLYGHLFPEEMDRLAAGLDAAYRSAEEATETGPRRDDDGTEVVELATARA
jgi:integrase